MSQYENLDIDALAMGIEYGSEDVRQTCIKEVHRRVDEVKDTDEWLWASRNPEEDDPQPYIRMY